MQHTSGPGHVSWSQQGRPSEPQGVHVPFRQTRPSAHVPSSQHVWLFAPQQLLTDSAQLNPHDAQVIGGALAQLQMLLPAQNSPG